MIGEMKSTECDRVVGIVGMFPPPLNGMSAVTLSVADMIGRVAHVHAVDCSPRQIQTRSGWVRARKAFMIIGKICLFFAWSISSGKAPVYMSLSSGWGQVYDLAFVLCARLRQRRVFLHHHGYGYLDRKSPLAALLFWSAGSKAVHIVACEKMASDLKSRYSVVSMTRRVSGIISLPVSSRLPEPRTNLQVIGFLSNVSREKGIEDFVKLAERAQAVLPTLTFQIAGPFQDRRSEVIVDTAVRRAGNLSYVGPVYGQTKADFLNGIDLLVFPTQMESEGLVIHEAHERGIPVITNPLGCIPSLVCAMQTLPSGYEGDFSHWALKWLKNWVAEPAKFMELSLSARIRYDKHLASATRDVDLLVSEITTSA